jgi:hypothetical protein
MKSKIFYILISFSFLFPKQTHAWGTLSHAIIGYKTGTGPGYNNNADFWAPQHYTGLSQSPGVVVSPYFMWSHELRRSLGDIDFRNALEPTYIPGNENSPVHHAQILLDPKLKSSNQTFQNTYQGWRAHNIADHLVHYTIFTAPKGGTLNPISIVNTWRNHTKDEDRVSIILYVQKLYGGDLNRAFLPNGKPAGWKFTKISGDQKSDAFINLLQKVFRKKQGSVDTLNPETIPVQGAAVISGLRKDMENGIAKNLFGFTRDDYFDALNSPINQRDPVTNKVPWREAYDTAIAQISQ